MKRRNFLTGLGGITLALPALRAFTSSTPARAGGATGALPRRVIVMAYPMGTHVPAWRPTAEGAAFDLPMITAPLMPFRDRCLFVSNCGHDALDLGGNAFTYGHPAKKEAVFTGTLLQVAFGGDGSNHVDNVIAADPGGHDRTPNGASIEHVIGQSLDPSSFLRPSVDLGVWGPGGVQQEAQTSDFFYEGVANPVTMQTNPATAFADLFAGVDPSDEGPSEALLALRRRNKSVLDAVRDGFTDLRSGLDPDDQRVLDEHAAKIRDIELDMPTLGSCVLPEDIPMGEDAFAGLSMNEMADLHNRILAHAMGCGVAPVGRIEYMRQQKPFFGIPTVDDAIAQVQDWHHPIVHASDGIAPDYAPRLEGFRFFIQKFADLLGYLDAIPEGDGTSVLDNTLVLIGSDYASGGGHASRDLGFIVAGNAGDARLGYHFDADAYNVNHFLTSVCQMAGATEPNGSPIRSFGLPGFVDGPIPELF